LINGLSSAGRMKDKSSENPIRVSQPASELAAWHDDDLSPPELLFNRELSLLTFTRRVLEMARDENIPLLERLRFLCISCTNLDEFFEVRVAAIRQRLQHGANQPGPDGLTPAQTLDAIRSAVVEWSKNSTG
jgi:polyphosphate kinase